MKDVGNKDVMAKNLKHYMAQKGIKAGELSKAIRVPYTTVRSWIRAENYPRIDKIEDMASYFGVLKSDLIEDNADRVASQQKTDMVASVFDQLLRNPDLLEATKQLIEMDAEKREGFLQMLDLLNKK